MVNLLFIKLNFDSIINHNKSLVVGFVIRDCIIASPKKVGHASIIVIKTLTLRECLQLALKKRFFKIQVEDDSKLLFDDVKSFGVSNLL